MRQRPPTIPTRQAAMPVLMPAVAVGVAAAVLALAMSTLVAVVVATDKAPGRSWPSRR